MASPNLPTNIDASYAGSTTDPSVDLHQQIHDTVDRFLNKFDVDAVPGDGQVLTWEAATSLYKPKATGGAGGSSFDATGTPLVVSAASGGTGAYPVRPATTRPVLFRGNVPPATNGSTAGGGGIVVGLDQWVFWTSADTTTIPDGAVTTAKYADGSITAAKFAPGAVSSGGGTAVDDSTNLSSATLSTTAPWSANQSKTQILGLINDASTTATNRAWSASKVVSYVAANSGGSGSASAGQPLDASIAPFNVSTTGTRDANGAGLLAAVQAAGKRPVTLPPGRYKVAASFTNEDINIDAPGAVLVQPSVANDTQAILTIERSFGTPVSVGPTRVVEWGPRLPGGVSSSARYTAIDLTSGNYNAWRAGDLAHISSQDAYPWTWSGQGIADYSTSTGLYWQAEFLPILGIGILVNAITNGGPQEQMMVQGSTSGAQGLVMADLIGNASGGITATQKHVTFATVTGDFVSGETLTRIAGGNPQDPSGGTIATVGQAVGTVSGAPMLLVNKPLTYQYGVVTAANITAGGAYGAGTKYPNRTDNTVRLRKVDRTKMCYVRAQFDIDGNPGDQDAYVASASRYDMLRFRGVYQPEVDIKVYNAWTRACVVTSCYEGRWRGAFDGLANHALLDQNGFGYGFECKCASQGNEFELVGRNLRHSFTTNPNPRTFSTSDTSHIDYGTPMDNTVHDSVGIGTYTNTFDTHPGDIRTTFRNCLAVGGGSGGRYNSDGGANFASRGFATQWINCKSVGSVEGIDYLGAEHDSGFDHTTVVRDCDVLGFQAHGFLATDTISTNNHVSLVIDGGRFIGDGSATNVQYQHEAIAVGKGIKATIKGEVEVGGFNGFPLRMREVSGTTLQSELDIISMLIDYRGATTSNAQGIRIDGTLARANYDGIRVRLADGSIPGGLITNRGGATVHNIGSVTLFGLAGRTFPILQTASQGGTPTTAYLTNLGSFGGGGSSSSGGTQVSVDGVNVSTLDISSTPVVQALAIAADIAGPAAANTLSDLTQFQTALAVGSYLVEGEMHTTASIASGGALRFGLGGPGSAGATITNIRITQSTSTTAATVGYQNALATSGTTAVTTAGSANCVGLSAGAATVTLPFVIKGRLVVTTAGTLGVVWQLTSGATATVALKAGSYLSFTKVS